MREKRQMQLILDDSVDLWVFPCLKLWTWRHEGDGLSRLISDLRGCWTLGFAVKIVGQYEAHWEQVEARSTYFHTLMAVCPRWDS